jgi:hypothetical protein
MPVPCQVGLRQLNKKLNFFILIPRASRNFTSHQNVDMILCRMSTGTPDRDDDSPHMLKGAVRDCVKAAEAVGAAAYRDRTSALATDLAAILNKSPECNVIRVVEAA